MLEIKLAAEKPIHEQLKIIVAILRNCSSWSNFNLNNLLGNNEMFVSVIIMAIIVIMDIFALCANVRRLLKWNNLRKKYC